jgi:hypothetical protein
MFEYKNSGQDFSFKADDRYGYIKGYGSTFDNRDLGGDIVARGAFGQVNASEVQMFLEHDRGLKIGMWDVIKEDQRGLYVEGKIDKKNLYGGIVYDLLRKGDLGELSIGYRTLVAEPIRHGTKKARKLKSVMLDEISVVKDPMNPEATIDEVKSLLSREPEASDLMTKREFEKVLRDAGLSRKMAHALLVGGQDELHAHIEEMLRDAASLKDELEEKTCGAIKALLEGGYSEFVKVSRKPSKHIQRRSTLDRLRDELEIEDEPEVIAPAVKSEEPVRLRDAGEGLDRSKEPIKIDLLFFAALSMADAAE